MSRKSSPKGQIEEVLTDIHLSTGVVSITAEEEKEIDRVHEVRERERERGARQKLKTILLDFLQKNLQTGPLKMHVRIQLNAPFRVKCV